MIQVKTYSVQEVIDKILEICKSYDIAERDRLQIELFLYKSQTIDFSRSPSIILQEITAYTYEFPCGKPNDWTKDHKQLTLDLYIELLPIFENQWAKTQKNISNPWNYPRIPNQPKRWTPPYDDRWDRVNPFLD